MVPSLKLNRFSFRSLAIGVLTTASMMLLADDASAQLRPGLRPGPGPGFRPGPGPVGPGPRIGGGPIRIGGPVGPVGGPVIGVGPRGPVAAIRWNGRVAPVAPPPGMVVRGPGGGPIVIRRSMIGPAMTPSMVTPTVIDPSSIVLSPTPSSTVVTSTTSPSASGGNSSAVQISSLDSGPASQAGLKLNDIILQVDNTRTRTFDDLRTALTASNGRSMFTVYKPDTSSVSTVEVSVVGTRIGASVLEVPISLEEDAKPAGGDTIAASSSAKTPVPPVIGSTREPEPASGGGATALQISTVGTAGANQAGLVVGDIILGVDSKRVTTEAELDRALKSGKDESDIMIYRPDTGKVETRKVAVANGSIGTTVQVVPVEIQN